MTARFLNPRTSTDLAAANGLGRARRIFLKNFETRLSMGIHDFDLARWFIGDVKTVSALGATIAYPELATVGDIDNAIVSLVLPSLLKLATLSPVTTAVCPYR